MPPFSRRQHPHSVMFHPEAHFALGHLFSFTCDVEPQSLLVATSSMFDNCAWQADGTWPDLFPTVPFPSPCHLSLSLICILCVVKKYLAGGQFLTVLFFFLSTKRGQMRTKSDVFGEKGTALGLTLGLEHFDTCQCCQDDDVGCLALT